MCTKNVKRSTVQVSQASTSVKMEKKELAKSSQEKSNGWKGHKCFIASKKN